MNGSNMEAEGAASLAEALKTNTTLQSIRCISKAQVLAFAHKRQGPLTVIIGVPWFCSINDNDLTNYGNDFSGVIALAEALKVNTSLSSVRWNVSDPHPIPKASLCA